MESALKCSNIKLDLGKFCLDNISFELPKGMVLGVIGANGCGKTTLLRTILGLYQCDEGVIEGKGIENNRREMVAILSESMFRNTSFMKIDEAGELYGRYYQNYNHTRYMDEVLRMGIYKKDKNDTNWISELSKGETIKQQIAFAKAVDSKLIVCDEPAGNLDVKSRDELYQWLREKTSDEECSVIFATHLTKELDRIADYILWMESGEGADKGDGTGKVKLGKIRFYGSIDELKEKYKIYEGLELVPQEAIVYEEIGKAHRKLTIDTETFDEAIQKETDEGLRLRYCQVRDALRFGELTEIMYGVEKSSDEKKSKEETSKEADSIESAPNEMDSYEKGTNEENFNMKNSNPAPHNPAPHKPPRSVNESSQGGKR